MKLNELSNYIAGVFNIDINDIIYLNSEKEMISPSIKIVNMMILYPQKFKSIIIANKKEKANQSQDYNSTSMNNLNQVSQIKSDVESQSKNIYAYDDKYNSKNLLKYFQFKNIIATANCFEQG